MEKIIQFQTASLNFFLLRLDFKNVKMGNTPLLRNKKIFNTHDI
jgi:hypothetical protein